MRKSERVPIPIKRLISQTDDTEATKKTKTMRSKNQPPLKQPLKSDDTNVNVNANGSKNEKKETENGTYTVVANIAPPSMQNHYFPLSSLQTSPIDLFQITQQLQLFSQPMPTFTHQDLTIKRPSSTSHSQTNSNNNNNSNSNNPPSLSYPKKTKTSSQTSLAQTQIKSPNQANASVETSPNSKFKSYKKITILAYQFLKPRIKEMIEKSKECKYGKYGCSGCNGFISPLNLTKIGPTLLTAADIFSFDQRDLDDWLSMKGTSSKKKVQTKIKPKKDFSVLVPDLKMLLYSFGDVRDVSDSTAEIFALILQRYVKILLDEIEKLLTTLNPLKIVNNTQSATNNSSSDNNNNNNNNDNNSNPSAKGKEKEEVKLSDSQNEEKERVSPDLLALVLIPDLAKIEQLRYATRFIKNKKKFEVQNEFEVASQGTEVVFEIPTLKGCLEGGHLDDENEEENREDEEEEEEVQEKEDEGESSENSTPIESFLESSEKRGVKDNFQSFGFHYSDSFWFALFGNFLRDSIALCKKEKEERHKYRDQLSCHLSSEDFIYFQKCTSVAFHRPNKIRMGVFLREECNLEKYSFVFSPRGVDMLSILMYNLVEEIARKTLQQPQLRDSKPKMGISPVHIGIFFGEICGNVCSTITKAQDL